MGILDELGKKILFCDGGLGSLLQERGLKPGELPETWNITKPEVLIDIHKAYLEAGAASGDGERSAPAWAFLWGAASAGAASRGWCRCCR